MSQLLKVLFVIDGLGRSGTERSLAEMLPHLAQAQIEPHIAFFNRNTQGVESEIVKNGFLVHHVIERRLDRRIRAVRQIIEREQPHIVHTALFYSSFVGRLAAAGRSAPVLTSLVNTPYAPVRTQDPNINRFKLRVVQFIDSWTSRRLTAHFHAVSHAVKSAATSDLGIAPDRITVIPRGRDEARLGRPGEARRRAARSRLGYSDADELLVNVGRHEFQKAQMALLLCVAQLVDRRPRLRLLIAGREGSATAELRAFSEKANLSGIVEFLGYRVDIPEILAAADLFVFPSLFEGMPGAVIEAMALGLPIVASNIAPNREVVEQGKNATLVEVNDPAGMASAIDDLLSDPERLKSYARHSRALFECQFTLERSTGKMIDLYHRLSGGR